MLLENPAGPYAVGATTFALPIRPTHVIGTAALRTETGQVTPALRLEEVSFTAYYPVSAAQTKSHSNGSTGSRAESVRGYSRYAGISSFILWPLVLFFGSLLQVLLWLIHPSQLNSELHFADSRIPKRTATPRNQNKSADPKNLRPPWPLVIFSHGLGGGGTTYSQICTHLASSGKVVLAIEHRDGTSPISRPLSEKTGKRYSQFYISPQEVVWDNGKDKVDIQEPRIALRTEQLELRKREIYLGYSAFRKLVRTGEHGDLQTIEGSLLDSASWAGDWVQCDEGVSLVGHSFGGATIFSMLSDPSPKGFSRIPVSHGLVLDPWLEPLTSPGPEPFTDQHSPLSHPKLMVINAEGFTLWKDHFKRLEEAVPAWPGSSLFTIVGARHVSFSDFPMLLPIPIRNSSAQPIMNVIKTLVLSFLDDTLPSAISSLTTRKPEIEDMRSGFWSKKTQRKLVGQPGDVVIHRWSSAVDVDT
ncbi:platelet-activating factor acetylhydrolase, isoform II-domain-containing protein [Multifurca ochricompacta]|uniref:1-alkyl-2-acetylglycerophosphocholine esterase n=1 Tax=Multifurca ochricompacta TaxID=376703 RepID=A0AAD4QSG9_9AGAM|nr:platelet-activating factor acetylhydrolase, isoform II-domain-containing protein [Multifurca ochricompacta]